ncbi:MAG: hypothetical protein RIQ47_220 [Bacteroidota bacterium]
MLKKYVLIILALLTLQNVEAQTTVKKVVLQGYWWNYYNAGYANRWANYLTELAPRLKAMGIDAVWIPPIVKNENTSSVGYAPFDHYDLGDKFQKGSLRTRMGTKDEVLRMIAVLHANGIEVIQDVVLNHVSSAGSLNGAGGQDPNSYSMASSNGYKNFRYVSYSTPASAETQSNYWSRTGRWHKNYTNFYPYPGNNCTTGDICGAFFGPDIAYETNAFGPSSNVIGFNVAQSSNYMRNSARDWMMWFKKQTAVDGYRWDAVKHFSTAVQEDFSYNVKYLLPSWCKGNESMFNVGEWVGSKTDLDNYVNAIAAPTGEKMMGAFDFNLRAFDPAGGLYGMVYGNGGFNMASLPGSQQNERVAYYSNLNMYVHRTVSFVNNHDTFRPITSSTGNYTGWNSSSELSPHIEPNQPRLSAAYAVIMAMDGNPQVFFEDLFDIGYNGNRFNHDPKSNTALPARSDIVNLIWCHQALDFKSGAYRVPFANADYLVIERAGKAVIGITDNWSVWQNQTVQTSFAPGTVLRDYSGANGTATVTVGAGGWVSINTAPVNPALNIAGRKGYSVWAPVGKDGTVYRPTRPAPTTQEWEMANDLGDSHTSSLMQGGAIPASSTNFRTAGRVFAEAGKPITYILYPENTTRSLFIGLYNSTGTTLSSRTGLGTLTGTYTPTTTGWITIKVRNSVSTNPSQRCWVNITYTAPSAVTNSNTALARNTNSVWSGNSGTSEWTCADNWEDGMVPGSTSDVLIPANAFPPPCVSGHQRIESITIEDDAEVCLSGNLEINSSLINNGSFSGQGKVMYGGHSTTIGEGEETFSVYPNPSSESITISSSTSTSATDEFVGILYDIQGRQLANTRGTLAAISSTISSTLIEKGAGVYFLSLTGNKTQVMRIIRD